MKKSTEKRTGEEREFKGFGHCVEEEIEVLHFGAGWVPMEEHVKMVTAEQAGRKARSEEQ